jgi:hypothetical protein
MIRLGLLVTIFTVVASLPARADDPAAAAPLDRLRVGAAIGKMASIYSEDDRYNTAQGSLLVGWRWTEHLSLELRGIYHGGSNIDHMFDHPGPADQTILRVLPSLRVEGRYPWLEVGFGYTRTGARKYDGETRVHNELGADLIAGVALAPASWPVRPHLELGFAASRHSGDVWIGAAVEWH